MQRCARAGRRPLLVLDRLHAERIRHPPCDPAFKANTTAAGAVHTIELSGEGVQSDPPHQTVAPVASPTPQPVVKRPQLYVTVSYVGTAGSQSTHLTARTVKSVARGATVTGTCPKGCARKRYVKYSAKGGSVSLSARGPATQLAAASRFSRSSGASTAGAPGPP